MTIENPFKQFLSFVPSSREVSLVIANTNEQIGELSQGLMDEGFHRVGDERELMRAIEDKQKAYYVVGDSLPKPIRDVVVQYPTGQIEIFNSEKMASEVVLPHYEDTAFVVVTTDQQLQKMEKDGFSILDSVGLTFRS